MNAETKKLEKLLSTKLVKIRLGDIHFMESNRKVNEKHVANLRKSVLACGEFLRVLVVAVHPMTKKYVVIDGQHGYSVFNDVDRNKKIYCVVSSASTEEEIVEVMKHLNKTSMKWATANYINAYASLGNKSYNVLREALKENTLTSATLPMLMTGESRGATKVLVEGGAFQIVNENWEQHLKLVNECFETGVIPTNGSGKRAFAESLISLVMMKTYNHQNFINNLLSEDKDEFLRQTAGKDLHAILPYFKKLMRRRVLRKVA